MTLYTMGLTIKVERYTALPPIPNIFTIFDLALISAIWGFGMLAWLLLARLL